MARTTLAWIAAVVAIVAAGERAPAHGGGRVVRVDQPLAREVFVPAGSFAMGIGSAEHAALVDECSHEILDRKHQICTLYDNELSNMEERQVFVSAFWIDRDEVSVGDYRACVHAGGCPLDPLITAGQHDAAPTLPVVDVTWDEAQQFCHWRGGQLPTEAQWERAARGDDHREWPWGDLPRPHDFNHGKPRTPLERELERFDGPQLGDRGEPDDTDGAPQLAPVGSYGAFGEGPYGTRDQAGNAAEWTADVWLEGTNGDRRGYEGLGAVDPERTGPVGSPRVVRGGSWLSPEGFARTNARDPLQGEVFPGVRTNVIEPNQRFGFVGFRCARSPGSL